MRTTVFCTLLLTAVSGLAASQQQDFDQSFWVDRILGLDTHGGAAFHIVPDLIEWHPDRVAEVAEAAWSEIEYDEVKRGIMKAAAFRDHPDVLRITHLGATDPSPYVRTSALTYIHWYAFRQFAEDYPAYLEWYDENGDRPLEELSAEGCRAFVERLKNASDEELRVLARESRMYNFSRFDEVREAALDAGILDVLTAWITPETPDRELLDATNPIVRTLQPPRSYVEAVLLPAAESHPNTSVRTNVLYLLMDARYAWLVDFMLDRLLSEPEIRMFSPIAQALGEYNDPVAIPFMIGVIDALPCYEAIYGVGYFGLGRLTGVRYDETHDGAWWRDWWERNKMQYSADVQALEIPDLRGRIAAKCPQQPEPPRQVSNVPVDDRRAGSDPNKRYFLIGDTEPVPEAGFGLFLVLPGGDGSADFHPFVRRIHENSVPDGMLTAQLVSKEWSPGQFDRVVWPTKGSPWEDMEFSTEEFVAAVVEDVAEDIRIDRERVYLLAWSSGGAAAYPIALDENVPITGAFIAMSVFKPAFYPPLENAAGRAFYILHSPDDFIPIRMAEQARDQLAEHGATTHLQTYAGGHGWHGDVFGMIRTGLDWLDRTVTATQRDTRP